MNNTTAQAKPIAALYAPADGAHGTHDARAR